jgi:hypothetical protein
MRLVAVLILTILSLGVTTVAAQQRSRNDVIRREVVLAVTTVMTVPQLDIKPGSCPNPVNPRSRGRIPIAIVGGGEFDVSEIDLSTIALTRSGDPARVYPVRVSVEDVATPHMGGPCACSESGADGTDDLVLHFETQDIVSTLSLDSADEEVLELTVVGRPYAKTGTSFIPSSSRRHPGCRRQVTIEEDLAR